MLFGQSRLDICICLQVCLQVLLLSYLSLITLLINIQVDLIDVLLHHHLLLYQVVLMIDRLNFSNSSTLV
jgi:hypothetical protein